jgi:hypothetical protein
MGAEAAPGVTSTKPERQIGTETRAVRIFRDVFAKEVAAVNRLKPCLDKYLKLVLDDPSAKRGDKTYARKIYADLLRVFGGDAPQGLPDWANKTVEEPLSDKDIQEILSAADPSPEAAEDPIIPEGVRVTYSSGGVSLSLPETHMPGDPIVFSTGGMSTVIPPDENRGMDIDPLDGILEPDPLDPVEQVCRKFLAELMATNELPFVRVFSLGRKAGADLDAMTKRPARYVALGTVLGTVTMGKHLNKKVNIHCTIAGFKRLRDAEKDHFLYIKGHPLSVNGHDPNTGLRKHIFCIHHTPGLKIRYWTRINDKDVEDRARFFVLSDDNVGVRAITRAQF